MRNYTTVILSKMRIWTRFIAVSVSFISWPSGFAHRLLGNNLNNAIQSTTFRLSSRWATRSACPQQDTLQYCVLHSNKRIIPKKTDSTFYYHSISGMKAKYQILMCGCYICILWPSLFPTELPGAFRYDLFHATCKRIRDRCCGHFRGPCNGHLTSIVL